MLLMLFSIAITSVLVTLFLASLGRGKLDHVIVVGIMAAVSLAWLTALIVSVPR